VIGVRMELVLDQQVRRRKYLGVEKRKLQRKFLKFEVSSYS